MAVERLAVRGPALDVAVDAAYGGSADPGALRVSARALGTDVRTALRLWPAPVVPLLRRHLADNALGGTVDAVGVEVALTGAEMTDVLAGRPTPDSAVRAEYVISGGVLTVVEGLPPLSRLDLSGTATGTKVDIVAHGAEVRMADGRALTLPGGTLRVPNVWAADSTAHIATRLQGGADALASLLRAPLLKEMAGIELDPANAKGRVDLRLTLPLPLNPIPPIDDMPLSIAGTIDGLAVDKAVGSDRLEDANLTVAYDRGSLAIKGEGRLAGSPATVEVRQPRGEPGEAVVAFGLDEAGRTRRGLSFGSQLTGPVAVRIVQPLGRAGAPARVEADLTRAALDNLVPGWTKPAGRPGKLSFTVAEGSPELRDVALDSGPVQARGTAVLSNDGQLDRLDLSSLKLSPNDQMRVLLERQGPLRRVTIRGAAVDARPFVKGLTGPSGGVKDASDLEIDLALGVITGFNDESLTNPAAKIAIRGRDVRQVTLAARMRGSPLTASLERTGGGPAVLDIQSGNAGATLRFLDIYRRMAGGILSLQVTMGQEPQRGRIWIDSFSLRDEPAMARLAATAPASNGVDDAARVSLPQIDTKDVPFQRLRAEFQRSETRLDFRDAVMSGPNVGFTAGGWIDYGRDRTDISGTFVPAFGLNNAFNQVPLIGLFLGGRDEGLFAVNFRISGPASAPALSVNPLSAVAPGFLRKLFGVGGDSATVQGVPAPRAP